MKIIEFEISNYRAIENIKFSLKYSMNPIIGINESGKTSVLKAILAFDKTRDKLNDGEHLEYQNKYSTNDTKNSSVTAKIELTDDDIKELIKELNLKTDGDDYKYLSDVKRSNDIFILKRNLETKSYEYKNDNVSQKIIEKIQKFLVSNLPFILYFDDFTDRVPTEIKFPPTYTDDGKITVRKNREWHEIIEEIFKRADTDGIENNPLKDYMSIQDKDRKSDILSDVQDTLNTEIIEEWKRIKKTGRSFADDSENLEVVITHDDNTFSFKVKDKAYKGKKRTFAISERSKGFQWFFNYMVKLKFNPNYKKSLENSIFLLDEPGSYLHSSAQVELLKELERVSKNNTIIYCTHSQYLLIPDVIKLGSIKIAEKNDSQVKLVTYGGYKSQKDLGALSPVYQALHLNFAIDHLGKIVITEGVTDYYLFEMIKKQTDKIDNNIKFLPGYGAKQLSSMISLAISFSTDFLIFLDNDKEGKEGLKKYKKEFGEPIKDKIFTYGNNEEKFVLEDYLQEKDTSRLLELTNTDDVKRALSFLYYDYNEKQGDFFKTLDMTSLEEVFKRLESL